ncbi:MAG TPA: hypothetical protein DCL21_05105 [Alphaproteobacteria bacterium]|nr:hypothetical protein [Alphaproteobacteria bacterium]
MATIQELETKRAKYVAAIDEIILGQRLIKGDVDGVGNAEFQTPSIKAIKAEIADIDRQLARLKRRRYRGGGTPRIGGF